ncbi:hypothetical protein [Longimicrobium sp.]|uniref:hypothetical protein n=1 Tax=Longimicrobium sp. TaxID=2029185 RepID=UPI003B3B4F47
MTQIVAKFEDSVGRGRIHRQAVVRLFAVELNGEAGDCLESPKARRQNLQSTHW